MAGEQLSSGFSGTPYPGYDNYHTSKDLGVFPGPSERHVQHDVGIPGLLYTVDKQETTCCGGYSGHVVQDTTHPKRVSSAEGVPDGPLRWLCRVMQLKASSPRRMPTGPGTSKTKSARQSPVRCFNRSEMEMAMLVKEQLS